MATWYTIQKAVERSRYGGWRDREKDPKPWPHSGKYILAGSAKAAIRRFARWLAANPQAKTNHSAPHHIIRNAAQAQKQLQAAAEAAK